MFWTWLGSLMPDDEEGMKKLNRETHNLCTGILVNALCNSGFLNLNFATEILKED
jgi:hypothetical protein